MSQHTLTPRTTVITFVVRFWREPSASGTRWRGRVEHVESGASAVFLSPEQLVPFFRRFGIGESAASPPIPDAAENS